MPPDFGDTLSAALDAGDVAAFQLRLKHAEPDALAQVIDWVRPIVHARGVALILNDWPDLAVQTGCDGAHVGTDDMPPEQARRVLGAKLQLGVSCYDSRDAALRAGEAGADYVAFGAFYPSATKNTGIVADLELLKWWSELMEPPVVAIGGITVENCTPLVLAGANFLAVSVGVWGFADGPAAGVRAFNQAISKA